MGKRVDLVSLIKQAEKAKNRYQQAANTLESALKTTGSERLQKINEASVEVVDTLNDMTTACSKLARTLDSEFGDGNVVANALEVYCGIETQMCSRGMEMLKAVLDTRNYDIIGLREGAIQLTLKHGINRATGESAMESLATIVKAQGSKFTSGDRDGFKIKPTFKNCDEFRLVESTVQKPDTDNKEYSKSDLLQALTGIDTTQEETNEGG